MTARTRCDQWSCRTTVDLDHDPAALQDCGHVICDRCVTCDQCDTAVYGMCTGCGSVEVGLVKQTGTRNLAAIGEHHAYPVGYGCEVCA